jgi:hypothetical protein
LNGSILRHFLSAVNRSLWHKAVTARHRIPEKRDAGRIEGKNNKKNTDQANQEECAFGTDAAIPCLLK